MIIKRIADKAYKKASLIFDIIKLVISTSPVTFIVILIFSIIQGILPLGFAWAMKSIMDLITLNINKGTSILSSELIMVMLLYIVLVIVTPLLSPIRSLVSSGLHQAILLSIKKKLFIKVNDFVGISNFENEEFQKILSLGIQGAQTSMLDFVQSMINIISSFITVISFTSILVSNQPIVLLVVVISFFPQTYVQIKINYKKYNLRLGKIHEERLLSYLEGIILGIDTAKENRLYNSYNYIINKFEKLYWNIYRNQRKMQLLDVPESLLTNGISTIAYFIDFVIIIIQAQRGIISLGDFFLYTSSISALQVSLSSIVNTIANSDQQAIYYDNYRKLITYEEPERQSDYRCSVNPLKSGIEFRNISFRYSKEMAWVLKDLNLFIPYGKCVAIIGANGAGKSTLVKILCRLYEPTLGQILWDGINIKEFSPEQYRSQLSVIFQDYFKYALTAKENIGIGYIKYMDDLDRIHNAAIKANIHDQILSLPLGYQTFLSRNLGRDGESSNLSGGEWQKIALSRLYLSEANVIILDEPTASLDFQSEAEFITSIKSALQNKTSLLISHRFSTVRTAADYIAILEDGMIKEYGTHDELIIQNGIYAKMYYKQLENLTKPS